MDRPSEEISIMIIGGGSAGLLIAQAMKKAGISCVVFEQDASINTRSRDWNFGIYWAQSPLHECIPDEINQLMVTAQVDNHTPSADDFVPMFNNATGERLINVPSPYYLRLGRRKFIRLISTGVDVQYGKRLSKIEANDTSVTATFEDGTSHTASLLIGCEGAHSLVREYLLGPEKAELLSSPLVCNATLTHLPPEQAVLARKPHKRHSPSFNPNGTFMWIGIHDGYDKPEPADWEFMFLQTWIQEEPLKLTTSAEIVRDMKNRVESFADPFRGIIKAIPDDAKAWHNRLKYWPTQPFDNHGGKVTIAGDAAHPMTFHRGQGLNNAIHDAATLYKEVSKMPSKTREALAAAVSEYEKEMVARGNEAVLSSLENSLSVHDWSKLTQSPLFKSGMVQRVSKEPDSVQT